MPVEVGFTGGEGRLDVCGPLFLEVSDLGEPLAAQQFFGYILRGLTDAGNPDEPDPRRLRRWLGPRLCCRPQKARSAGRRGARHESAAILDDLHRTLLSLNCQTASLAGTDQNISR